ncbi:MAG: hypothetical protein HYR85_13395 [Planctomycetes bacterium]|nr:hypothetical protein [Planctomycetota bacterium]MBI3846188.1 hypothetical protein [Planctomycetota bacterium]
MAGLPISKTVVSRLVACAAALVSPCALAQTAPSGQPRFMGAGSCSGTACHAFTERKSTTKIQQNEWYTWLHDDPHPGSYMKLKGPGLQQMRANQIGANLGITGDAADSPRCLVCHAIDVPESRRAPSFEVSLGVGCEACHGASDYWLAPHSAPDWAKASESEKKDKAWVNMEDLVVRAERCLSCHLGDPTGEVGDGKRVFDHDLLGAGHPDLPFELERYLNGRTMKHHWLDPKDQDAWFGTRTWAVGEVVALDMQMKQLAEQATHAEGWGAWPEFSNFDCYDCHHIVNFEKNTPTWRQEQGTAAATSGKRTAGRPRWNASRSAVVRHLVERIAPNVASSLATEIAGFQKLMDRPSSNREAIAESAKRIARLLDDVKGKLSGGDSSVLDEQATRDLLLRISGDTQLSQSGVQTAKQAALSIESLYSTFWTATHSVQVSGDSTNDVRQQVNQLVDSTNNVELFNPKAFARALAELHQAFEKLGK